MGERSAEPPERDEGATKKPDSGRRPKPDAGRRAKPAVTKAAAPKAREQHLHVPSDVDALGQDKHRKVIGQRYGLSRSRQLFFYGVFLACIVLIYIGGRVAVDHLDKAPAHDPDRAPWSRPDAPQEPLGGFEPQQPGQKGPADFQ